MLKMSGPAVIDAIEKEKVMTMISHAIIRNVTVVRSHDSEVIIDILRRSADTGGNPRVSIHVATATRQSHIFPK